LIDATYLVKKGKWTSQALEEAIDTKKQIILKHTFHLHVLSLE
jgi:hypothetical protein